MYMYLGESGNEKVILVWEWDIKLLTDHVKHNGHLYPSAVKWQVEITRVLALVTEVGTADDALLNDDVISEPGGEGPSKGAVQGGCGALENKLVRGCIDRTELCERRKGIITETCKFWPVQHMDIQNAFSSQVQPTLWKTC